MSHTCAMFFALAAVAVQGLPKYVPEMKYTVLPALPDLIATTMQHSSLYNLLFPTQTLMKTLKVIPVMLVGRFLKNRTYSTFDYIEGALLTGLVAFFVTNFQLGSTIFP